MTNFQPLKPRIINEIRFQEKPHGILFKDLARTSNISDLGTEELIEMYHGFYKDKKVLLTDGDYCIDMLKVKSAYCTLEQVTYIKPPLLEDYKTNRHHTVKNIRTFYIRNYFLVSTEDEGWGMEHDITKRLVKAGAFKKGHNNQRELYRITNDYIALQGFPQGNFPKDLFHPIKNYINGFFFGDDYRINDFHVVSKYQIH